MTSFVLSFSLPVIIFIYWYFSFILSQFFIPFFHSSFPDIYILITFLITFCFPYLNFPIFFVCSLFLFFSKLFIRAYSCPFFLTIYILLLILYCCLLCFEINHSFPFSACTTFVTSLYFPSNLSFFPIFPIYYLISFLFLSLFVPAFCLFFQFSCISSFYCTILLLSFPLRVLTGQPFT